MGNEQRPSALQQTLQELTESARGLDSVMAEIMRQVTKAGTMLPVSDPSDNLRQSASATLILTPGQRLVCERVINVYETGFPHGRYGAISIFEDGPNDIRQITYGRSQTTEYGNLRELVQMYVDAGGHFSDELRVFLPKIGRTALVDDTRFKDLLRRSGNEDPVMRQTQDSFFDRRYFEPALRWASENGFTRALSVLVIYDSFIHSGSILPLLRSRFPELPPARGGREEVWISQYVGVRHRWLAAHSRPIVRQTIYRTRDLTREVERGNWDLARLPILANGVPVDDSDVAIAVGAAQDDDIAFLGEPRFSEGVGALTEDSADVWSEAEPSLGQVVLIPPVTFTAAAAAAATPRDLAMQILTNSRIKLATSHVSGVDDEATARDNILDTAAGRNARRSNYGNAPGGTVALDMRLLQGIATLATEYSFSVSELAGANHSPNSRHYAGLAADFNILNGQHVRVGHPDVSAFQTRCRSLGATEVLGPGQAGHSTHVHAAWPR